MRPIDAEPLEEILRSRCAQHSDDYGSLAGAISGCLKLVQAQPTIAPLPNDPLTLEELRGMDGEPVWIVTGSAINAGRGLWDICDWWDKDTVMFPYSGEQPRIDECGITWMAYRRKPEEGMV